MFVIGVALSTFIAKCLVPTDEYLSPPGHFFHRDSILVGFQALTLEEGELYSSSRMHPNQPNVTMAIILLCWRLLQEEAHGQEDVEDPSLPESSWDRFAP